MSSIYSKESRILEYRNKYERALAEIGRLTKRVRELEERLLEPTDTDGANALPNPGGTD